LSSIANGVIAWPPEPSRLKIAIVYSSFCEFSDWTSARRIPAGVPATRFRSTDGRSWNVQFSASRD
jgi:hypothetical protein